MVTGFEVVHPMPHEDLALKTVPQVAQTTETPELTELNNSESKENDTI
jgi:hypothetical protein